MIIQTGCHAILSRCILRHTLMLGILLLASCAQTAWRTGSGLPQTLATANQMMDIEEADRITRFERLARLNGVTPPVIDQLTVPASEVPGATRPIPVIRVVFDERVFFDTGNAAPRPEARRVVDLIAENMRHDVPDLRITILGHTDAVGTTGENLDLSRQRALTVLQILVHDGVDPAQLGTVAIGTAQPVASNATAAGRARNRRVEFLISPSEEANLQVVQRRRINRAFLSVGPGSPISAHASSGTVQFLKPTYSGPADVSETPLAERGIRLASIRAIPLQPATSETEETGSPAGRADLLPPSETTETGSPVAVGR